MNKGELVYVPSQVCLMKFDETSRDMVPRNIIKTEKPKYMLVIGGGEFPGFVALHHAEDIWWVNEGDIYPEKENHVHKFG